MDFSGKAHWSRETDSDISWQAESRGQVRSWPTQEEWYWF